MSPLLEDNDPGTSQAALDQSSVGLRPRSTGWALGDGGLSSSPSPVSVPSTQVSRVLEQCLGLPGALWVSAGRVLRLVPHEGVTHGRTVSQSTHVVRPLGKAHFRAGSTHSLPPPPTAPVPPGLEEASPQTSPSGPSRVTSREKTPQSLRSEGA